MSNEVIQVAQPISNGSWGSAPASTGREIIERDSGMAVALNPDPMSRQLDFWSSFPPTREGGRELVLKAMSSNVIKGTTMIGKPFAVCDAVCHPVELEDEKTGEVSQEVRTVLIMPSGEMVSFVSRGLFKGLGLIGRLYGPLPWSPPKVLLVTQFETAKRRRSYNVEVVRPEPEKPATGRRRD